MIMDYLRRIAPALTCVDNIFTLALFLVKPFRERIFKLRERNQGLMCLLRSDMLRTYYKHRVDKKIRQHESENFEDEYLAYKALGGNSFVDKIHAEVLSWETVT